MPTCLQGHASAPGDFCSVCGLELEGAPVSGPLPSSPCGPDGRAPGSGGSADALEGGPCPLCAVPRSSESSVFCENCGCNFTLGQARLEEGAPALPPVRWEVEARVLPETDPEAPREAPVRVFPLDLPDLLIGRRSPRRGVFPEISLDGDDGVSHRHARLRRRADGGIELLELGSANGTTCNGQAVEAHVPLALAAGDRLRLGRWTEIHLRHA